MSDIVYPDSLQAYFDSLTPAQKAENARWASDRLADMQWLDAIGYEGPTTLHDDVGVATARRTAAG